VAKLVPNFVRLDASSPDITTLMHAMLRAREVVTARSWATSQESTTECWWADVLADPRATRRSASVRSHRRLRGRSVKRAYYTLADEPCETILVACSKCPWQGAFSRADLISKNGANSPLPNLLARLAMPGCPKIKSEWDRCGVYYVNPIEGRERYP
jgi:hypothetical protein